jgi:hypothetical protein
LSERQESSSSAKAAYNWPSSFVVDVMVVVVVVAVAVAVAVVVIVPCPPS